jgi:hypothetical protein
MRRPLALADATYAFRIVFQSTEARSYVSMLAIEQQLPEMWIRLSLNVNLSPVAEDDLKFIQRWH